MVSAWWLLVAFWIGGLLGLVLGALLATARRAQDATQDQGEPPK
jgi:ABC-type nitrate/sulfonate/bicarbonate transport system permease component